MNKKLQEKIDKIKEKEILEVQKKKEQEMAFQVLKQKEIDNKISEAKEWVQNSLLDFLAKEDIVIEKINKNKTGWPGDLFRPKELQLSHSFIPKNIPIESVAKAIQILSSDKNELEGISTYSSMGQGYYLDDDHACYVEPEKQYYVKW